MRGETNRIIASTNSAIFQSTPLMRGETIFILITSLSVDISIHSPHARGDCITSRRAARAPISIHSPHARGDPFVRTWAVSRFLFQSTPLMRGETNGCSRCGMMAAFQSTPLMRGETDDTAALQAAFDISIHSPHARGDLICAGVHPATMYFNPLPSCEGRLL